MHFRGLNALNMQKHFLFVLSFEHINFALMENIPKAFGYIHNIMSQTQLLYPFQKGKDLKLEIEMACNHCTKFMV